MSSQDNDVDTPNLDCTKYPYTSTHSTNSGCAPLIASLLASKRIEEISSADDCAGVERYVRKKGFPDSEGRRAGTGRNDGRGGNGRWAPGPGSQRQRARELPQ